MIPWFVHFQEPNTIYLFQKKNKIFNIFTENNYNKDIWSRGNLPSINKSYYTYTATLKLFDSLQIELMLCARPQAIQINIGITLNSHTSLVAIALEENIGTTIRGTSNETGRILVYNARTMFSWTIDVDVTLIPVSTAEARIVFLSIICKRLIVKFFLNIFIGFLKSSFKWKCFLSCGWRFKFWLVDSKK